MDKKDKVLVSDDNQEDNGIIHVRDKPWMPQLSVQHFKSLLLSTHNYLEFGSGGSTIFAAKMGVSNIFSVESNERFLSAIHEKLIFDGYKSAFYPIFVNIGPTRKHGYPVNNSLQKEWSKYPLDVWRIIREKNTDPDLILVDGRFRVACFLSSLLNSPTGTTILFDDYEKRKHYWIVEKYCSPAQHVGRMAEFHVSHDFDRGRCNAELHRHLADPR